MWSNQLGECSCACSFHAFRSFVKTMLMLGYFDVDFISFDNINILPELDQPLETAVHPALDWPSPCRATVIDLMMIVFQITVQIKLCFTMMRFKIKRRFWDVLRASGCASKRERAFVYLTFVVKLILNIPTLPPPPANIYSLDLIQLLQSFFSYVNCLPNFVLFTVCITTHPPGLYKHSFIDTFGFYC
jgi:hypothetical protein